MQNYYPFKIFANLAAFPLTALIFSIFSVFLLQMPVLAQDKAQQTTDNSLASIIGARASGTAQRARLVLDLSKSTKFAYVSIEKENSNILIAVDVKASDIDIPETISSSGTNIIKAILVEKAEAGRIRIWLELSDFAQVQQAYVLDPFDDQPARLVVDIVKTSAETFKKNAANDIAYSISQISSRANLADNSNAPGELNVDVAAKAFIVIDPGHGGIDNGASASNGVKEKDIVLEFAKELQKILVASGAFEVALTRSDDSSLRLGERISLARMNKADLFISLHADSFSQASVGGTSIYTRDEEATSELDKILAENENMGDMIAGFAPPNIDEHAVSVLVDLMRREMRKKSFHAASAIVDQLKPSIKLRQFPIRGANFLVLQSPDIPSILIELGFLSNSQDVKNLTSKEWRTRVSQAIARGVASYFDNNTK